MTVKSKAGLFSDESLDAVRRARKEWEGRISKKNRGEDRQKVRKTSSGEPIELLYTPEHQAEQDYLENIGFPGEYPYTRGIHPTMYRGKPWTMRMFSGFATPRRTNERYHFLLSRGQDGLSVAFDMPTLMGRDSDDPLSQGEVGKCGVAISTLKDMEILFDRIPLDKVSTSMTINGPAAVIWAMYIAAAERQGVRPDQLRGTCQNDILKEYIAQKEFIFPPEPSMRLVVDTIEHGTHHLPQWNTVSISGYHIREAGATALQELAFTLADGMAYVDACLARGMNLDSFAPRLSFFFDCHNHFFEEIAKFRAARRIWARKMREKYGAKDSRSWLLRFHTQTAGVSLTAQQPENNIMRTAYQALAGVLGGTQSLHTNSMDETLALPTEKAVQIALRTQQVLLYETGVADTVDPLAGSYYVEHLTDRMEAECEEYFKKIEAQGGVIRAVENGFFQREIARSAYQYQKAMEEKEVIIVGVNEHVLEEEVPVETLKINQEDEDEQVRNVLAVREARDPAALQSALDRAREAAMGNQNLMPHLIQAVKCYATLGELVSTLKDVFGSYREPAIF